MLLSGGIHPDIPVVVIDIENAINEVKHFFYILTYTDIKFVDNYVDFLSLFLSTIVFSKLISLFFGYDHSQDDDDV